MSDATDEKLMADLSWFEKDLDDFELQLPDDVEEDEGQGGDGLTDQFYFQDDSHSSI